MSNSNRSHLDPYGMQYIQCNRLAQSCSPVHQAMPSPRLTVKAPSIGSTGVQCLAVGTAFQMLPILSRSGLTSMSLPGAISKPVSPAGGVSVHGCKIAGRQAYL